MSIKVLRPEAPVSCGVYLNKSFDKFDIPTERGKRHVPISAFLNNNATGLTSEQIHLIKQPCGIQASNQYFWFHSSPNTRFLEGEFW